MASSLSFDSLEAKIDAAIASAAAGRMQRASSRSLLSGSFTSPTASSSPARSLERGRSFTDSSAAEAAPAPAPVQVDAGVATPAQPEPQPEMTTSTAALLAAIDDAGAGWDTDQALDAAMTTSTVTSMRPESSRLEGLSMQSSNASSLQVVPDATRASGRDDELEPPVPPPGVGMLQFESTSAGLEPPAPPPGVSPTRVDRALSLASTSSHSSGNLKRAASRRIMAASPSSAAGPPPTSLAPPTPVPVAAAPPPPPAAAPAPTPVRGGRSSQPVAKQQRGRSTGTTPRAPPVPQAGKATPRATTPASSSRGPTLARSTSKRFMHVSARYMDGTVASNASSVAGARPSSVPPPSRYVRGVGHTRSWVDVTSRTASDAATLADMNATYSDLLNETTRGTVHPTLATSLTVPVGDLNARARSVTRTAGNSHVGALYGRERGAAHPLRRSSRAMQVEDEVETARAAALGLIVGARPLTSSAAAETASRMYGRAVEARQKAVASSALLPVECTFTPLLTRKGATGRVSYPVANMNLPPDASTGRPVSPATSTATSVKRYEALYANAAAQALTRARALETAVRDDLNCTFTPVITRKARALSTDGDVSHRLYAAAATIEAKRQAFGESIRPTFQPQLCDTSLEMAKRPRSVSVASRPALYETSNSTTAAALAARKAELDLIACTFRPNLSASRPRSRDPTPVHQRLHARAATNAAHKADMRASLDLQTLNGVTHKPALNATSERLVKRSRSRSVDPVAPPSERLYADARAIAARLEVKRASLATAAAAVYKSKPSIDPHSRLIVMRTHLGATAGAGLNVPSNGHPTRMTMGWSSVWDRLYTHAREGEEARADAIRESLMAEMASIPFIPVISERSRRIAEAADRVLTTLAGMRPEVTEGNAASSQRAAVWDRLYAQALSEPEVQSLRAEMARRLELRDCTFQPRLNAGGAAVAAPTSHAGSHSATRISVFASPGTHGDETVNTSGGKRDVHAALAADRKDYKKLEEIRARLELAECTFQPNVNGEEAAPPMSGRRSSNSGLDHSSSRPAAVWERIVAEVEAESAAPSGLKLTASVASLGAGSHARSASRSRSPAIFDRLYLEGVEKSSERYAAQKEAKSAALELENCTFTPDLSQSFAHAEDVNLPRSGGEIHDRLFREAAVIDDAQRAAQAAADEAAKRLASQAVEMARDADKRAEVLAEEAARLKRSMTGAAIIGKPHGSSPLTHASSRPSGLKTVRSDASALTMGSVSPYKTSPAAPAIALRSAAVVPEEGPAIAVRAARVVDADDEQALEAQGFI